MKKWFIYNKKADFKAVAAAHHIDQVTARILRNREINSDAQIEQYLHGSLEELHSPLLLPDAIRCMNHLNRANQQARHISIDEDYGCESRDILPPASAVVDAKREDSRYPYTEICGAVVAWKIITLLYQNRGLPQEAYLDFLEFAAIATVCDVVELQDENRIIVKFGLQQIRQTTNPGLRALLDVQGLLEKEHITSYHIGYIIGPCINAGGRLRSAEIALSLFTTTDPSEALAKAVKRKELNEVRKGMTIEAPQEALMAQGSGRSIDAYPMSERLAEVADLLTKFGGHPLAAGFSLPRDNIDRFRTALNARCGLQLDQLVDKLWIDVPMPVSYVTEELIHEFDRLEPYGKGNEKPCFAEKNLRILEARVLGKGRNVVRLQLLSQQGTSISGILFTDGDAFMRNKGTKSLIDVVYYPEVNEYNGFKSLQIVIEDYQLRA